MTAPVPEPVALSAEEHQRILIEEILPAVLHGTVPQTRPVAVVVAGHTGAGKSTQAAPVKAALDRRGGAAWVASDQYKPLHPASQRLQERDDPQARQIVRTAVRRWQRQVEDEVRARQCDVVVESALVDLAEYRQSTAAYRGAGYPVELLVAAASEPWTQLGILERFLDQGRWVGWRGHDDSADALMAALVVIEKEHLADRITVVDHGGARLYENTLTAAGWQHPGRAAAALAAERERPWSAAETWRWRRRIAVTERRLGIPGLGEERALAVGAEMERAQALAEPVRRLAQIVPTRPGVDFHRLSQRQHDRIFEQVLTPLTLHGAAPAARPTAVFVVGQPGADLVRAASFARHSLGGDGVVTMVRSHLQAAHPDYRQLLASHPRTAPGFIRADVDAWQQRLDQHVRATRAHLVAEVSPLADQELWNRAVGYQAAGYRIDLVLVATGAAASRQHVMHTFAQLLQRGAVTHLPAVADHDASYTAVAQIADAASDRGIDTVTVLDPSGHQLHRSGSGRAAARALEAVRTRPYTAAEATVFASTQQALRAALPQYRTELDQIADLARPLLPAAERAQLAPEAARNLPLPSPDTTPSSGWRAVVHRLGADTPGGRDAAGDRTAERRRRDDEQRHGHDHDHAPGR